MPNVTLFAAHTGITNWEYVVNVGSDPVFQDATEVEFINFDGSRMIVEGTGFTYDVDGNPTGGTVNFIHYEDSTATTTYSTWEDPAGRPLIIFAALWGSGDFDAIFDFMMSDADMIQIDADGDWDTGFPMEVSGGYGIDTIAGGAGDDLIYGDEGDDVIDAGAGDDDIQGNEGNDTIDGGADWDVLQYHEDFEDGGLNAVTVNFDTGQAQDGFGFTDSFQNIEAVTGTQLDDTFFGGPNFNRIRGGAGNDLMDGTVGNQDEVDYRGDHSTGVTVNLETGVVGGVIQGAAFDNFGGIDTLIDIERVSGSNFDDVIDGSSEDNRLRGRDGNDIIRGHDGDDTLEGGNGNDLLIGGDGDDIIKTGDNTSDPIQSTGYKGDYIIGGTGVDTIDFQTGQGLYTLDYSGVGRIDVNLADPVTPGVLKNGVELDAFQNLANINSDFGGLVITGTSGIDSFIGQTLATSWTQFNGGDGADSYNGGAGFERLDFQGGTQGVDINLETGVIADDGFGNAETVSGSIEEVHGSQYDDTFVGTAADDRFIGRGGDDSFDGGTGGFDMVRYDRDGVGGINIDLAAGTASNDGEGGADTLTGIEYIRGSKTGDDVILGSGADERLRGNGGDDILDGAGGDDMLEGGDGNDLLTGGDGDDIIKTGNNTDDQIQSTGFWGDTVIGGSGNDIINFWGAQGYYTLDYSQYAGPITADLAAYTVFKTGGETDQLWSLDDITEGLSVHGTALDDTFIGQNNANSYTQFRGSDGVDTYTGGAGFERLDLRGGTQGIDIDLSTGDIHDDGFGNAETFSGSIEEVHGTGFDDTFVGSAGDDRFIGRGGADSFDGGDGFDMVRYDRSGVGAINVDLVMGTADDGEGSIDTLTSIEHIRGSKTGDDIISGDVADERFDGRGGNDHLQGGGGNDILRGEDDNDVLEGGAGFDTLDGGAGADELYGGDDDDWLIADLDDTVVDGGGGFDHVNYHGVSGNVDFSTLPGAPVNMEHINVHGDAGVNNFDASSRTEDVSLFGAEGDDILTGGAGGDDLWGDQGADELYGGDGNDWLLIDFDDTVIDGGADYDSVGFNWQLAGNLDLASLPGMVNVEHIKVDGDDGDNNFDGSSRGEDLSLYGNGGIDVLTGGAGLDILDGGAGDDTLTGGVGLDAFTFTDNWGQDTVTDFNIVNDVIDLTGVSGISGYGDLVISEVGGNAVITFGPDSITLLGVPIVSIAPSLFYFSGGGGDPVEVFDDLGNSIGTFVTIQDAIDASSNGYSIQVADGFYGEDVIVNKEVSIFGANSSIPGDDPLRGPESSTTSFEIQVSNVIIDGFEIVGSANDGIDITGAGLFDITVQSNFISSAAFDGIQGLQGGSFLTVADNYILDSGENGGSLTGWQNSQITGNLFSNNGIVGNTTLLLQGDMTGTGLSGNTFELVGHAPAGQNALTLGFGGTLFGLDISANIYNGFPLSIAVLDVDGGTNVITEAIGNFSQAEVAPGVNGPAIATLDGMPDIVDTNAFGGPFAHTDSLNADIDPVTLNPGTSWLPFPDNAFEGADAYFNTLNDAANGSNEGGTVTLSDSDFLAAEGPVIVGIEGLTVTGSAAANAKLLLDAGVDDITLGGDAAIDVTGNASDNVISANAGDNILEGGIGDDVLYGKAGNDTLNGGEGNDIISGLDGADQIDGGIGDDKIWGGDDTDSISGGAGLDILNGQGGDDSINGGDDADVIDGGIGGDNLSGDGGDDKLYGRAGIDFIQGGLGDDRVWGGDDGDTIYGNAGLDVLDGENGDDQIFGGDDADVLRGGAGLDTLSGENGDDRIWGGDDADFILGGAGLDTLNGESGDDEIHGGDDRDTLDGGIGDDQLYGDGGDDRLFGRDGFDVIYGGDGVDVINGGLDDDQLYGDAGNDVIFGKEGNDYVEGGTGDDMVSGLTGEDAIYGDAGNDTLYGGDDNDFIYGGADNDKLYGGGHNDFLVGDAGNDRIEGGGGVDDINGGAGTDKLFGQGGNDHFFFDDDWDLDIIYDFADGSEFLNFTGNTAINSFADVNVRSDLSGNNTVVEEVANTGNWIFIVGVDHTDITDLDFNF